MDKDSAEYKGSKVVLAELDPELSAKIQKIALETYKALRVRDYGRVDLRMDEAGNVYVIEVNASCYLERNSELSMAAMRGIICALRAEIFRRSSCRLKRGPSTVRKPALPVPPWTSSR